MHWEYTHGQERPQKRLSQEVDKYFYLRYTAAAQTLINVNVNLTQQNDIDLTITYYMNGDPENKSMSWQLCEARQAQRKAEIVADIQ